MENDDIFAEDNVPVIDPTKNYLEEFVGEGKKFKDAAALARAKAESDTFIERIKRENEEMRRELQKATTAEEILKKIQEASSVRTTEQYQSSNQSDDGTSSSPKPLSQEELDKIIEQKIRTREAESQADRNYRQVVEAMSKAWGEHNLSNELERKARELGYTKEQLKQIAVTSPNAFLKLVDISGNTQTNTPQRVAQSSVNTMSNSGGPVRNWAYYQAKRKEMGTGKYYADVALQNELAKQRMQLGDDFYK
jgi:hypothetical protein